MFTWTECHNFRNLLFLLRSVQPVPPLPRPPASVPFPQRTTSVDNEYLEILADQHENCSVEGYINPIKGDIRVSGEDDKPYEKLHMSTELKTEAEDKEKDVVK